MNLWAIVVAQLFKSQLPALAFHPEMPVQAPTPVIPSCSLYHAWSGRWSKHLSAHHHMDYLDGIPGPSGHAGPPMAIREVQ